MHNIGFRAIAKGLRRGITLSIFAALLSGYFCAIHAQGVPVTISPQGQFQAWDGQGRPLSFGCVFSYATGSATPLNTYTDNTGLYTNSNPVILSAGGAGNIWIQAGQSYRLIVKGAGGTKCALGSTIYTIDGIGGGVTTLTTNVAYSATPTFQDSSQNQLFTILLTGNASSQPLTAVGVVPPGLVSWQITQDGVGGHIFTWPANTIGGTTICLIANCVTQQTFLWNGTNATAVGAATYSTPAMAVPNLFDFGLTASSNICVNSLFEIVSGAPCNAINTIVVNGQTIFLSGSGNVNAGAAAHSMALNEGLGNPLTGLLLGASQIPIGAVGADPVASTLPTCTGGTALSYGGTPPLTCVSPSSVLSYVRKELSGDVAVTVSTNTTLATQAVTMPSSGCPCRSQVSWSIGIQTAASGGFSAGVSDGSNFFAASQGNATGSVGGNTQVGISMSGWSHITYANGAVVTFTLKTESVDTGYTVKQAFGEGQVQNSGMDIVIFPSN